MNKNITSKNSKNRWHGYVQRVMFSQNTKDKVSVLFRGNYKNSFKIGYHEWHSLNKCDFHIR